MEVPGKRTAKGQLRARADACTSCPYLKSTPSGVWAADEYDKLATYDAETWEQPTAVFLCHHSNHGPDTLCAGWVACHGEDLLALRLAAAAGRVDWDELNFDLDGVYSSGREARSAGSAGVQDPGPDATKLIGKLTRALHLRAGDDV